MPTKFLTVIYICLTFWAIDFLIENKLNAYAQTEVGFQNHTIGNKFSVSIPPNWHIETMSRNNDFFILTSYEPEDIEAITTNSIKTEVVFIAEPLDVILENHLRAINKSEENIIKQGDIIIDGRSAKRIWYQGNGLSFPNTISSYISYSVDLTVIIHSYYDLENPKAIETIERIHWSFKNLN